MIPVETSTPILFDIDDQVCQTAAWVAGLWVGQLAPRALKVLEPVPKCSHHLKRLSLTAPLDRRNFQLNRIGAIPDVHVQLLSYMNGPPVWREK